jgi:hypothetical protein
VRTSWRCLTPIWAPIAARLATAAVWLFGFEVGLRYSKPGDIAYGIAKPVLTRWEWAGLTVLRRRRLGA